MGPGDLGKAEWVTIGTCFETSSFEIRILRFKKINKLARER